MPTVFLCQSISCWVVSTHAPPALRSRCCSWPDSRSSRSLRHSVMSCSRRWMKSSQTDMRKRLSYSHSIIPDRGPIDYPSAGWFGFTLGPLLRALRIRANTRPRPLTHTGLANKPCHRSSRPASVAVALWLHPNYRPGPNGGGWAVMTAGTPSSLMFACSRTSGTSPLLAH